jgi:hypothetical protein
VPRPRVWPWSTASSETHPPRICAVRFAPCGHVPNAPRRQYGHAYWAIWRISFQLRGAIVLLDGKANGERKEAMLARFDHRPMLTAALALATIVLVVAVVTLSTLLITSAPASSPSSVGDGGKAGPAAVPGDRLYAGGKGYGPPIK